jgi:hypothetical protein
VQRFYLSAAQGLARQRVSIGIYEGQLRIEYHQTWHCQVNEKPSQTPFPGGKLKGWEWRKYWGS